MDWYPSINCPMVPVGATVDIYLDKQVPSMSPKFPWLIESRRDTVIFLIARVHRSLVYLPFLLRIASIAPGSVINPNFRAPLPLSDLYQSSWRLNMNFIWVPSIRHCRITHSTCKLFSLVYTSFELLAKLNPTISLRYYARFVIFGLDHESNDYLLVNITRSFGIAVYVSIRILV